MPISLKILFTYRVIEPVNQRYLLSVDFDSSNSPLSDYAPGVEQTRDEDLSVVETADISSIIFFIGGTLQLILIQFYLLFSFSFGCVVHTEIISA